MYYGTLNKIGVTCVEAGEEANFQLLKKKKVNRLPFGCIPCTVVELELGRCEEMRSSPVYFGKEDGAGRQPMRCHLSNLITQ